MGRPLKNIVCDDTPAGMGLCCVNGFLCLEDIRCKATSIGYLTPAVLSRKTNLQANSSWNTLNRWRQGHIKCVNLKTCVLVKTGLKNEPLPQFSPEHVKFLKLKGQSFDVWRVKTSIERIGPEPIRGRVVYQSRESDWLWIGIALEYSPITVKLGDQLEVSPEMWGTVVLIDGPLFYLLLPGDKHGVRVKRLEMGGTTPSHLKPWDPNSKKS